MSRLAWPVWQGSIYTSPFLPPASLFISTGSFWRRNTNPSPFLATQLLSPFPAFFFYSNFSPTKYHGLIRSGTPSTPSSGRSAAHFSPFKYWDIPVQCLMSSLCYSRARPRWLLTRRRPQPGFYLTRRRSHFRTSRLASARTPSS